MDTLKNRRSELGLSLAELSARTGLSTSSLWAIETGRSSPTVRSLRKIAHGLGCRVEDLIKEGSLSA